MKLDLTSLQKALSTLDKAIKRYESDPTDEDIRDTVIKRFEYSWDLCWKMIKRQLKEEMPSPPDANDSYPDRVREAAERGIVANVEGWMMYRTMRNITSHGYDEEQARKVYKAAVAFYIDAADVLKELEKRNQ